MAGTVKNIEVSTISGVVPPNGKLMIIAPLDEQLLIEARILRVTLRTSIPTSPQRSR